MTRNHRRRRPPTGPDAPSWLTRQGVRRSCGRCQHQCRRAHSRTVAKPLLWLAPPRPYAPRHCLPCIPLRLSSRRPSRVRPGSPLHIPSDHDSGNRTDAILYFPEKRWGGHDLLCKWSAHTHLAIQSGLLFYLSAPILSDLVKFSTSRRVTKVHPSRAPRHHHHRQLSEGFSTHPGRTVPPPWRYTSRPRASCQLSSFPLPKSTQQQHAAPVAGRPPGQPLDRILGDSP